MWMSSQICITNFNAQWCLLKMLLWITLIFYQPVTTKHIVVKAFLLDDQLLCMYKESITFLCACGGICGLEKMMTQPWSPPPPFKPSISTIGGLTWKETQMLKWERSLLLANQLMVMLDVFKCIIMLGLMRVIFIHKVTIVNNTICPLTTTWFSTNRTIIAQWVSHDKWNPCDINATRH